MSAVLDATRELLRVLDPLAHGDRMRHLARWARESGEGAAVCADADVANARLSNAARSPLATAPNNRRDSN